MSQGRKTYMPVICPNCLHVNEKCECKKGNNAMEENVKAPENVKIAGEENLGKGRGICFRCNKPAEECDCPKDLEGFLNPPSNTSLGIEKKAALLDMLTEIFRDTFARRGTNIRVEAAGNVEQGVERLLVRLDGSYVIRDNFGRLVYDSANGAGSING